MTTLTGARHAATLGLKDVSPLMLGMAPFGMIAGIAAVEAGLPAWGATVFSMFIFAGAAQLAALELIGDGANAAVVLGTVVIINARFLLYSASMSTRFADQSLARRTGMAYLLTDQAYAVTITKLDREPEYGSRWAYYAGGALPLWVMWQLYTLVGALAGAIIPESIPLAFAIPLVFIGLVVPAATDRPTFAAAASSAVVAIVAADLPANLGLLAAAGTGIAVGYLISRANGMQRTTA